MSKEWKCTDCVKYKTDACSTCACGYTPTVSCRDVLVDFDYAYQQGRNDAINEFAKRIAESDVDIEPSRQIIFDIAKEMKGEK